MKSNLRAIKDQVIAVIGASSGMGLRLAQMASDQGAKVLLVSRNEEALREAVTEIRGKGGEAIFAVADVSKFNELQDAAHLALREYGRIDSWVHIAGVGHWGFSDDVTLEDARQLFDINFWGLVHGTRIALQVMKEQGGAVIALGSVESERALPYHSFYSASKQAIKAYVEAVRVETQKKKLPLTITLIKPASINTPFTEHARNEMQSAHPKLLPPVYHVNVAAKAILECCRVPHREITIGGSGRAIEALEKVAPRLMDEVLRAIGFRMQERHDLPARYRDSLDGPGPVEGYTEGLHPGYVFRTSLSTSAVLHPLRTGLILLGGLGLAAWLRGRTGIAQTSS